MAYLIHIKQIASGIVRRDGPHDGTWDEDGEFIWTDGNYSCDCNRALFWARAAKEEDIDQPCGDEAYKIRVTADDGKVLYDEFENCGVLKCRA